MIENLIEIGFQTVQIEILYYSKIVACMGKHRHLGPVQQNEQQVKQFI